MVCSLLGRAEPGAAHGIMTQCGGSISVSSEEQVGTTFSLFFPVVDERPSNSAIEARSERRAKARETVMLVEDDHQLRKLTRQLLEACGYQVVEASSPENAIELALRYEKRIDLLLTDVVMPKMSGFEMAERFKEIRPNIKILFVTGYCDSAEAEEALLNPLSVLLRPYLPAELNTKIRQVLASS